MGNILYIENNIIKRFFIICKSYLSSGKYFFVNQLLTKLIIWFLKLLAQKKLINSVSVYLRQRVFIKKECHVSI